MVAAPCMHAWLMPWHALLLFQVQTSIYTRPDGERVVRTVTSSIGRDGRVTQHVEERSLGGGRGGGTQQYTQTQRGDDTSQPSRSVLGDLLKVLAAPYIAAAAGSALRVLTRALAAAAAAFLRALLRRILGGR
jgi:hypothetical protein